MVLLSRCLSFLKASIRNLNYLRAKTFGFPPPRHPGDFRAVFSLPLNVFIAPYSSPRQFLSRGPWFLKAFGCLVKDFRHDKKRRSSPLSVSIRGPQYLKPKKKQKHGFLSGSTRSLNKRRGYSRSWTFPLPRLFFFPSPFRGEHQGDSSPQNTFFLRLLFPPSGGKKYGNGKTNK